MSTPKRFQAKRGQRLQPRQKLVGRSTRWGNPFPIREMIDLRKPPRLVERYAQKWGQPVESLVCETEEEACDRYRSALLDGRLDYEVTDVQAALAGFDLGCPCGRARCHADVLIELANPGA
jgi:hypothetical protein